MQGPCYWSILHQQLSYTSTCIHAYWSPRQYKIAHCNPEDLTLDIKINTKTLITIKMHKESFIINCNTVLHVSILLGHLQGELFVIVTLRLHFTVEWQCAVDCVLCSGGVNSLQSRPALQCSASRDRRQFTPPKTTQHTVNSTFSLNCKVQP
jgi:hypothetical protein